MLAVTPVLFIHIFFIFISHRSNRIMNELIMTCGEKMIEMWLKRSPRHHEKLKKKYSGVVTQECYSSTVSFLSWEFQTNYFLSQELPWKRRNLEDNSILSPESTTSHSSANTNRNRDIQKLMKEMWHRCSQVNDLPENSFYSPSPPLFSFLLLKSKSGEGEIKFIFGEDHERMLLTISFLSLPTLGSGD